VPDPDDIELEGQDLAEVFDEENITEDGRDIATSDTQRDVYDVTASDEDAVDALQPDDDFDPDDADEAELEEIVMAEEDLDFDEPRSFARDPADLVSDDDVSSADMEAGATTADDVEAPEYGDEPVSARPESSSDRKLDDGLEGTFPASDPVPINPGSD
jgi:hypothetical protein